jgi:hypothetical protein
MKFRIPTAALKQHIAFLGKTGSGKTSTAKLAVEQILRDDPNARICVLDPIKSDWWGLTSSANGRNPGLPFYILGGPRGHVQLHDSAGKAIGELVANGALPLSIIDMADFKPGGFQRQRLAPGVAARRKTSSLITIGRFPISSLNASLVESGVLRRREPVRIFTRSATDGVCDGGVQIMRMPGIKSPRRLSSGLARGRVQPRISEVLAEIVASSNRADKTR